MFIALCKKLSTTKKLKILLVTHLGVIPFSHVTPLYFITKSYSSMLPRKKFQPKNEKDNSFTVSYLVNSCGLSLEKAMKASKRVYFETPDRPDTVLRLLRNHGFNHAQIAQFVRIRPEVLLSNAEKTLLPKLDFFRSIGFSKSLLSRIISSNPSLLSYSLDYHIIPFYKRMKSVLNDDEKVVMALKREHRLLYHNFERKIDPNISVLREHGVPASSISILLRRHGIVLTLRRDKFEKYAKKVIEMGFNSSSLVFVSALNIIGTISESTWNRKKEVLSRLGWSEADFRRAFRSCPVLMYISDTKITRVMKFLVDEMGLESAVIAKNPTILSLSLQKRIIPRCSVIKFLLSKGLIEKIRVSNSFLVTEKIFLNKFVTKYEGYVPEIGSIYNDSRSIVEL